MEGRKGGGSFLIMSSVHCLYMSKLYVPGLSSTLQPSVPLGRVKPVNVTLPRFKMAASSSRIELMSSGSKPMISIAFWETRRGEGKMEGGRGTRFQ